MKTAEFWIAAFWVVVLFLIVREILTWYWKLNRIVDLLEKIEKNTKVSSDGTLLSKATKSTS